jgi:vacuolar-type H+-ATPase subunit I/STV1
MTDPLTASTIAALAFEKFIESGAGELAKKFTEAAIAKMDELRKQVVEKLRGRSERVNAALVNVEQGDRAALETIAKHLDVVMDEQPEFASAVKLLAHEINAGKLVDNSSMTQNNYDNAKGWQTKVEGGTAYIGEIHQHAHDTPSKP